MFTNTDTVCVCTAPTQYECGPHSSLIFQAHYHSQRHTNFLKISHFCRIFWEFSKNLRKENTNLMIKFDSQKLGNLSMSQKHRINSNLFFSIFTFWVVVRVRVQVCLETLIKQGHSTGAGEHSKILGVSEH